MSELRRKGIKNGDFVLSGKERNIGGRQMAEINKNETLKMSFFKGTHFRQFQDRMPLNKKNTETGNESKIWSSNIKRKSHSFRPNYYKYKKKSRNILKRSISTECLDNISLPFTASSSIARFSSLSLPIAFHNTVQDSSLYGHDFEHSSGTFRKKISLSKQPKYAPFLFYSLATTEIAKPNISSIVFSTISIMQTIGLPSFIIRSMITEQDLYALRELWIRRQAAKHGFDITNILNRPYSISTNPSILTLPTLISPSFSEISVFESDSEDNKSLKDASKKFKTKKSWSNFIRFKQPLQLNSNKSKLRKKRNVSYMIYGSCKTEEEIFNLSENTILHIQDDMGFDVLVTAKNHSKRYILIAGTIDCLVAQCSLSLNKTLDHDHVELLIRSFSFFCTITQFLKIIINQFRVSFRNPNGKVARSRISSVLTKWLAIQPEDICRNSTAYEMFYMFIEEVKFCGCFFEAEQCETILKAQLALLESRRAFYKRNFHLNFQRELASFYKFSKGKLKLVGNLPSIFLNPFTVAKYLAVMDYILSRDAVDFAAIKLYWHKRGTLDSRKKKLVDKIDRFVRRTAMLAHWIAVEILQQNSSEKRAKTICWFIDIAKNLYHLNDFHSTIIITNVLINPPVKTLYQTWAAVPSSYIAFMDTLKNLACHSDGMIAYRKLLTQSKSTTIPYFALYLEDMSSITNLPTYISSVIPGHSTEKHFVANVSVLPSLASLIPRNVDPEMINLQKFRAFCKEVNTFLNYLSEPYPFYLELDCNSYGLQLYPIFNPISISHKTIPTGSLNYISEIIDKALLYAWTLSENDDIIHVENPQLLVLTKLLEMTGENYSF
ncbi:hypothetical protein PNEG_00057 [Pneumocystis murina B123]|uniref:Ras-GEF domain-containing protein n=1 Tax=Pneumocystis murina (strain B123) TaxID=1069680 RepID=M7NWE4_PNEMU|nr:hypothetical protein PNEG_00057 [Pneumocystis murina B123]EMR11617.1 hypothetical protein PNEG_00057 [Pneumocystis murina B123]